MADEPHFLLDVTRLVWRRWKGRLPTGIDRVALAYLEHFGPQSQAVVQHERFRRILRPGPSRELFALLEAPGQSFKAALLAGFFKNLPHVKDGGRDRLYLNVGHTGLNSPGFSTWVRNADVRPIYFVHDLIPITHPKFARAGEDARHRERMLTVLTTATGVITNSQVTLDDLAAFARAESLAMPPAVVAWLGTDAPPGKANNDTRRQATFVALGTIEARKNHLLLLDVWSRLVERFGDGAPKLLIVGQRGWEASDVFKRLDHDEKLRRHVTELDQCSDQELALHLGSARALLFPSFTEGYGLPLVEALKAGVPAIASDLPVFKELCGNIPTYIDPHDKAGWEAAILDYLRSDSPMRAAQMQRMKGFRAPTWTQHFATVDSWLRDLG